MKTKFSTITILIIIFLVILILVDKLIIQKYLPVLYNIISFKTEIVFGSAHLKLPGLSLITFTVVPLIVLALYMIPYKSLSDKSSWLNFWKKYKKIVITSFWIPILLFIGALIYLIFKGIVPDIIQNISEIFSFSFDFSISSSSILNIEFGFIGVIGLLIGYYLWYRKGIKTL